MGIGLHLPGILYALSIKNSPLPLKNIIHISYFLKEYRTFIWLPSLVHFNMKRKSKLAMNRNNASILSSPNIIVIHASFLVPF